MEVTEYDDLGTLLAFTGLIDLFHAPPNAARVVMDNHPTRNDDAIRSRCHWQRLSAGTGANRQTQPPAPELMNLFRREYSYLEEMLPRAAWSKLTLTPLAQTRAAMHTSSAAQQSPHSQHTQAGHCHPAPSAPAVVVLLVTDRVTGTMEVWDVDHGRMCAWLEPELQVWEPVIAAAAASGFAAAATAELEPQPMGRGPLLPAAEQQLSAEARVRLEALQPGGAQLQADSGVPLRACFLCWNAGRHALEEYALTAVGMRMEARPGSGPSAEERRSNGGGDRHGGDGTNLLPTQTGTGTHTPIVHPSLPLRVDSARLHLLCASPLPVRRVRKLVWGLQRPHALLILGECEHGVNRAPPSTGSWRLSLGTTLSFWTPADVNAPAGPAAATHKQQRGDPPASPASGSSSATASASASGWRLQRIVARPDNRGSGINDFVELCPNVFVLTGDPLNPVRLRQLLGELGCTLSIPDRWTADDVQWGMADACLLCDVGMVPHYSYLPFDQLTSTTARDNVRAHGIYLMGAEPEPATSATQVNEVFGGVRSRASTSATVIVDMQRCVDGTHTFAVWHMRTPVPSRRLEELEEQADGYVAARSNVNATADLVLSLARLVRVTASGRDRLAFLPDCVTAVGVGVDLVAACQWGGSNGGEGEGEAHAATDSEARARHRHRAHVLAVSSPLTGSHLVAFALPEWSASTHAAIHIGQPDRDSEAGQPDAAAGPRMGTVLAAAGADAGAGAGAATPPELVEQVVEWRAGALVLLTNRINVFVQVRLQ